MPRKLRLKKLNNWNIQGPIVVRLLTHFMAFNVASVFLMMTVFAIRTKLASIVEYQNGSGALTFWQQTAPVIICMLVMAPFMVWDLIALTNRIAGPLFRFERLMKDFVKCGQLQSAALRDGDLLTDFQNQFNEFAESLHALYPETKPLPEPSMAPENSTTAVADSAGLCQSTGKNGIAISMRHSG